MVPTIFSSEELYVPAGLSRAAERLHNLQRIACINHLSSTYTLWTYMCICASVHLARKRMPAR